MRFRWGVCPAVVLAILVLLCAGSGNADPLAFSYSGTFSNDADVQFFYFYLSTEGTVTAETWSFGGGTDATGQTIPYGGFFPYLAIFNSNGDLTAYQSGGNDFDCEEYGCNYDPSINTYYYDAYIQTNPLPAGWYLMSLTEYNNVPLGPTLSDGFSQTDPYFTQNFQVWPNSCNPPYSYCEYPQNAPFLLYESGEKRTGNWEVDIIGPDQAGELPEPASLSLAVAGLALFFLPRAFGVRRVR
ncbi:MAG: DVUA0089 family protein [Bryobacteraceae bacterium]